MLLMEKTLKRKTFCHFLVALSSLFFSFSAFPFVVGSGMIESKVGYPLLYVVELFNLYDKDIGDYEFTVNLSCKPTCRNKYTVNHGVTVNNGVGWLYIYTKEPINNEFIQINLFAMSNDNSVKMAKKFNLKMIYKND